MRLEVGPFQDAFKESHWTFSGLARELEWMRPDRRRNRIIPDASRVSKVLGLKPYNPGHGYRPRVRTHVNEVTALRLVELLNLDPVDVGL